MDLSRTSRTSGGATVIRRAVLTILVIASGMTQGSPIKAQSAPNPNYNNGVYVSSVLKADGDGADADATCKAETQVPGGSQTATAAYYPYVSSYCVVSDPNGNPVSASEASSGSAGCPNLNANQEDPYPELGYMVRNNSTGDCSWKFKVTPGTFYTLQSNHFIWLYDYQGGSNSFECPSGYYYDYQDFWELVRGLPTGLPTDESIIDPPQTYDVFNSVGSGQHDGYCIPQTDLSNPATAGVLQLATTYAYFAAIGATPAPPATSANLYQTQKLAITSNLSALQAISGSGDSIQWCIEASLSSGPPGNCSADASTDPSFGTLSVSPNDANSVTYEAPDPIPSLAGDNTATVYVCAEETMNASNFYCLPIQLTQLTITLTPAAAALNSSSNNGNMETFTATINSSSTSKPPVPVPNAGSVWVWSTSIDLTEGTPQWSEIGPSTQERLSVTASAGATGTVILTVTAYVNLNYKGEGGTDGYQLMASAPITINNTLPSQTISFEAPPSPVTYGVAPITLSATASSGLPVNFGVISGPATVNGSTLTIIGAGTVVLAADQPGNSTYAAAPEVTQNITVTLAAQTITFPTIPAQTISNWVSVPLGAYASSGLPVSYASTTPSVCTVSGSSASLLAPGTCTIQASQPGDGVTYAPASTVTQSFTVQTIDLQTATNFGPVNIGSASGPQTLTFSFSAAETLGGVAVLTQGTPGLDFANSGSGTCTAGTNYNSGGSCTVTVTFTPSVAGTRYGAVVLLDGSGNTIATDYLQGTGLGPQLNFSRHPAHARCTAGGRSQVHVEHGARHDEVRQVVRDTVKISFPIP